MSFVSRSHPGRMEKKISELGYEAAFLRSPGRRFTTKDKVNHAGWLGVEWAQDAEETRCIIDAGKKPDWLIVDHYAIDSCWHDELRSSVEKILVIDDLADRTLNCDILLDQTVNRDISAYKNLIPGSCKTLLGSQYALLRPEFSEARNRAMISRKLTPGIQRVMVSMGGVDAGNYTQQVLESLAQVDWIHKPLIDVVMGEKSPNLSLIESISRNHMLNVTVSVGVIDMAERMLASDLAIGASGTTTWERCCLGLPSIVVAVAENQENIIREIEKTGAVMQLENEKGSFVKDLCQLLGYLQSHPDRLTRMSNKCFAVTDGLGALKVYQAMATN